MTIERVAVDAVHLDQANARQGDVAAITESLREFGQHRPLVVQRDSGRVLIGNHTLRAAMALGWTEVDVVYVDDDDLMATRRAIADNATGDRAAWDKDALAKLIETTGQVPGLTEGDVRDLLARLEPDDNGEPSFPLVPRMHEDYSYVVIVADNTIDGTWLETTCGLRKEASYSNANRLALGRVVTVARFRELLEDRGR